MASGKSKTPDELSVQDRVRRAMAASGLRQSDLARSLGISPAAVSLWFAKDVAKRTEPSLENLAAISHLTGVSLAWLRDGTGAPPSLPDGVPNFTRVRRNQLDTYRDGVRERLTKRGQRTLRTNIGVSVPLLGCLTPEAPDGEMPAYSMFYVDSRLVMDLCVTPPVSRGPQMSECRAALLRLSILLEHDRRTFNTRQDYVLGLIPPPGADGGADWAHSGPARVLGVEAGILGAKAIFLPDIDAVVEVIARGR